MHPLQGGSGLCSMSSSLRDQRWRKHHHLESQRSVRQMKGGRESCVLNFISLTFHWPKKIKWPQLTSRENGKCNPLLCPGDGNSKSMKNSNVGYKNWCAMKKKKKVHYLIQCTTNWKWPQFVYLHILWYQFKSWAWRQTLHGTTF